MKNYSVMLLYPDYLSDGHQTFYTWVHAAGPADAVHRARIEAMTSNGWTPDDVADEEDFICLLVTEGHNVALDPESAA
jgi:hypothetical protein